MSETLKNPPENTPRVVPMLAYDDAAAAIDFLREAFGFEERMRLDMPDGSVGHAELDLDGGVISLATTWKAGGMAAPSELPAVHSQLLVYVDDVDAHCERARAAGATIAAEPEDQFHGSRTYRAIDPEGHRWMFAQVIKDVSVDEMKKMMES